MDPRLPTELRHAYRALLRAVTYLPDAAARDYLHGYVVHRFRSVSSRIENRAKKGTSCDDLIKRYHSPTNIASARKAARQLVRAGQGSSTDLKRALDLTYGRAGKRRRQLVGDLVKPDENSLPEDQAALEELIQRPPKERPPRFAKDSKLIALMKSQQTNRSVESTQPPIRRLAPKLPEENIWGRKLPFKRQKSIVREHWKTNLSKILPPLPEHEWNRLRDFATGAVPVEKPVPRRSRSQRIPATGDENDAKLLKYFTTRTNQHTSEFDEVKVDTEQGATCWGTPVRDVEVPLSRHFNFTPRYMRRMYASIWNITPTVSQDQDTKKWIVKWGGLRSPAHAGHFTKATEKDLEFWEGLDAPQPLKAARQ